MSDKEKNKFHDMAETDKARHQKEMANWTPPPGETKGVARGGLAEPRKRRIPTNPREHFQLSSTMLMRSALKFVQPTQISVWVR